MGTQRDRLRELIDSKGLMQREVAEYSGVPEHIISKLLNGITQRMNRKYIEKLAKFFHVSPDWLRIGETPRPEILHKQHPASPFSDDKLDLIIDGIASLKNDVSRLVAALERNTAGKISHPPGK